MAMGRAVVAAALNRPGSLGPVPGKRSRGILPLVAASAADAEEAVAGLTALDAAAWRPFNLVVADARSAFFLRGLGEGRPEAVPLGEGVSVVTAHEPNAPASPRIRRHLPRFRAARPPEPDTGEWSSWEALLADSSFGEAGIGEALNVPPVDGFGTVCSSLAALGARGEQVWRFCPAPPGRAEFQPVALPS
jgi:hypothetical protein